MRGHFINGKRVTAKAFGLALERDRGFITEVEIGMKHGAMKVITNRNARQAIVASAQQELNQITARAKRLMADYAVTPES